MIIKSIHGNILFQSSHRTLKAAVEAAVQERVDLSFANLRRARLSFANLDGLVAAGACLWGADLTGADIGLASLQGADMRCADLKDACIAESNLTGSNLRGAYFSGTLMEGAVLDRVAVSCPSFWHCDLHGAASMVGLIYSHLGEDGWVIDKAPVVIRTCGRTLILQENFCLSGGQLYHWPRLPASERQALLNVCSIIGRIVGCKNVSHNAADIYAKEQ